MCDYCCVYGIIFILREIKAFIKSNGLQLLVELNDFKFDIPGSCSPSLFRFYWNFRNRRHSNGSGGDGTFGELYGFRLVRSKRRIPRIKPARKRGRQTDRDGAFVPPTVVRGRVIARSPR